MDFSVREYAIALLDDLNAKRFIPNDDNWAESYDTAYASFMDKVRAGGSLNEASHAAMDTLGIPADHSIRIFEPGMVSRPESVSSGSGVRGWWHRIRDKSQQIFNMADGGK